MYSNRYKYTFKSRLGTYKPVDDPIGWDKAKSEVGRSETTFGMFITVTNNLQFTGKLKNWLEDNYKLDGVNAKVEMVMFVRHPKTDEWQLEKRGYLDFGTRNIEERKLKLDFVEGGLRELLVSQLREDFELDRITDIKGNPIPYLRPDKIFLKGREIFLLSRLGIKESQEFTILSGGWEGGYREAYYPVPMDILGNGDPDNIRPTTPALGDKMQHVETVNTAFLSKADRDLGKVELIVNLSFAIFGFNTGAHGYPDDRNLSVVVRRYRDESATDGGDFVYTGEEITLFDAGDPVNESNLGTLREIQDFKCVFSEENTNEYRAIKKGESIGVYFKIGGDYATFQIDAKERMNITLKTTKSVLLWQEDSFFPPTTANFILANEAGKRLTEIYAGKPLFRSKLLTETWSELGFTCGFWIRNMLKRDEEQNEDRTMVMNFENFYKSIHAVEPCGYGIVTEGNQQYIALESLRYFFQPHITIRLGKVSKVKRRTAMEFVFSSITTGYTKGGNYEEPLGLDEYNIQTTNISPITNEGAGKYEVLGPSRTDSYAVEKTRRKPFETNPDEDTPFDRDNFLLDAKLALKTSRGSTYEVRLWQDDFEQAPTGVYSPGTAFNLRLTPGYNKFRHSYWFNASTVMMRDEKLRFASSTGNSLLTTKMIGKAEVKENSDTPYPELQNPIIAPEWIEFELPFSQEIKDQIMGRTKVGEEWINNYYGLVEFTNEENKKEKAYLFTSKIEEKITFKTLKAYGV